LSIAFGRASIRFSVAGKRIAKNSVHTGSWNCVIEINKHVTTWENVCEFLTSASGQSEPKLDVFINPETKTAGLASTVFGKSAFRNRSA
jgi:hypothetical protein